MTYYVFLKLGGGHMESMAMLGPVVTWAQLGDLAGHIRAIIPHTALHPSPKGVH